MNVQAQVFKPYQLLFQFVKGLSDHVDPLITLRGVAIMTFVYGTSGNLSVRDLHQALGISKPVATRALTRLAKAGLLVRVKAESDRRLVVIRRTMKGARWMEKVQRLWTAPL